MDRCIAVVRVAAVRRYPNVTLEILSERIVKDLSTALVRQDCSAE
ncbi:MAG TPA: hypothetical protein VMF32_16970 [Xanthobacteraceae bacterium]|nr:hypothetical protein [Xanthobacteraceae bacterium]